MTAALTFERATPRLKTLPEGPHYLGDCCYLVNDDGSETLHIWWDKWIKASDRPPVYVQMT